MQKKKKAKGVSEKQLMKLWSEICKKKANHKCEYPGCRINSTQLHAHHFFSRRHASIRYDPDNAVLLCVSCHRVREKRVITAIGRKRLSLFAAKRQRRDDGTFKAIRDEQVPK